MDTKLFHTDDNEITEAGEILRNGGLVAFPTETVYGLGASAFDSDAAKKIYAAKGRPSDNPLIVHICDKGQIKDIAEEIPESAKKVIDNFMPGPVTIILKKKSVVPNDVTAGLNTVAIRFPLHETAQKLINPVRGKGVLGFRLCFGFCRGGSCLRLRLAALCISRDCKDQATQKAGSHRRQPAKFSFLHGPCPPFRVPPASGQYGPKR